MIWNHGNEIYRVTGRKDEYGELESFICNTCRFEKKEMSDWIIEGPRNINRHSVIGQNHYEAPYQGLLKAGRSLPPKKDLLAAKTEEVQN